MLRDYENFLYTWKFVQAKSKQAMKQVLGIRDEKARMTVTPPLAMAPVTQEDDINVRYPRPNTTAMATATTTAPAAVRLVRVNVRVIPCMFTR